MRAVDFLTQKPPLPPAVWALLKGTLSRSGAPGCQAHHNTLKKSPRRGRRPPGNLPGLSRAGQPRGTRAKALALLQVCQMAQGRCFSSTQQKLPSVQRSRPEVTAFFYPFPEHMFPRLKLSRHTSTRLKGKEMKSRFCPGTLCPGRANFFFFLFLKTLFIIV